MIPTFDTVSGGTQVLSFEFTFSNPRPRMVKSINTNKDTKTCAVTIRPTGGIKKRDEGNLMYFLKKHCDQWEIFEEFKNDDPSTRHFHGRLLMKTRQRMDNLKRNLITAMDYQLAEKNVLRNGIKWLYDDWEYLRKDEAPWSRNITDEDEWTLHYADPEEKYEKKKNAEIHYYLGYIEADLGPRTTEATVKNMLMIHIAQDKLQMPGSPTAMNNLCWRITEYWNMQQQLADYDEC